MSWIALEDLIGALTHALAADTLRGPLNMVAPSPVTNAGFTASLARALSRPAIFPLPAFMARAALGEMAEAILLSSMRAVPEKLLASGYLFRFPEIDGALRHILARAD
jgi:hypothetical protein